MHHLLTGVDPRNGEPYAPVRQWNPELSEGIEIIIDRCVEPADENRYQTCADLLYDLEHPELITKGFKKKQKRKLAAFISCIALAVVAGVAGFVMNWTANNMNDKDYDLNVASSDPAKYYDAIELYPSRVDAYEALIEYYKNHDATNEEIIKVGNVINENKDSHDMSNETMANMYYEMGKLYFAELDSTLKGRAVDAKPFFEKASAETTGDFDKKEIAHCYYEICRFMTNQSTTSEHSLDDYNTLFAEIETVMTIAEKATDNEANYDKISLYYVTMLLVNDQAEYMAYVGFDRQTALDLMSELYKNSSAISSTLSYVNDLQDEIESDYKSYVDNINAKYNEVEKRKNGGN